MPQDRAADVQIAFARAQHLKHGINASEWFAQNEGLPCRIYRHYIDADIALMSKMGFDYVRLSIDAVPLDNVFAGQGRTSNHDFLPRLDKAVDTMLGEGLAVIIDVHPRTTTSSECAVTTRLWSASHALAQVGGALCQPRSGAVFFEILNEPEINDPYRWDGIQARVAAAIRSRRRTTPLLRRARCWSDVGICWRSSRWPTAM